MSAPKLLVHICCAPCLIAPYQKLRQAQADITGYWFNPNIHPYTEYAKRRDTVRALPNRKLPMLWEDDYALEGFLHMAAPNPAERCGGCYEMRLRKTAETAKRRGFNAFTTTLLYSKYQQHDLIKSTAQSLAAEYGLTSIMKTGDRSGRKALTFPRQQPCIVRHIAAVLQ